MPDTPTTLSAEDSLSSASHLDAAREFFPSPGFQKPATPPSADQKPATPPPAEQKPADQKPADAKPPVLPSILKKADAKPATPPPADQKPAEAPEFEKLVGPDEKSKHRPDWDKMKASASEQYKARTSAEQKLADLEKQLASRGPAEADAATKARIAQLEGQIKTYDEKLKVYDLQSHPEFVAQYVTPVQQAITTIKDTLKMEGIEANVDQLLALDGKAFSKGVSELLSEVPEFNKLTLADAFRKAKAGEFAKREALGKVDEMRANLQQSFAARSKAAFDEAGREIISAFAPVELDPTASDADKADVISYNAAVANIGKSAAQFAFGQTDERGAAGMAHKAAAYEFIVSTALPRLEKYAESAILARDQKIVALQKEITDLTGSRPNVSSTGSEGTTEPDVTTMSHLDAARKAWSH